LTDAAGLFEEPVTPADGRGWAAHPRLLVLFVAVAAYVNALGNGFAYDDIRIVVRNPVVTGARWGEALLGQYWQGARPGAGLYRPVTISSFVAQWHAWHGSPLGFHAVNLVLHAVVCLLVLALLRRFLPRTPSVVGALLFAIHPVHVEAVANVVGEAELVSAAAFLLACLLYLDGACWGPAGRAARIAGLVVLYLVGLGAKESAVTLPGALVLLELFRGRVRGAQSTRADGAAGGGAVAPPESLRVRLRRELPVLVSLAAVLGAYLVVRASVLGTVTGAVPAPALRGLTSTERVLTALTVWPQYVRLMVFPADLSADYTPAVLMVAHAVNVEVVVGAVILLTLVALAWTLRRSTPTVSLGLAWFLLTILPVSDLFFSAGILLAERTLYLPSVGYALVVGALAAKMPRIVGVRARRAVAVLAVAAGLALFLRTVVRNPSWMSSYTVMNTLAMQHPESATALWNRAAGLDRVGDTEDAARAYGAALTLAPNHYGLHVEVGAFYGRLREYAKADSTLERAIRISPEEAPAYRFLANELLRQRRGRDAHTVALMGLAEVGPDRELWDAVSESYVLKGDLAAAVRARRAALGLDPHSAADWGRLAELLAAMGRTVEADSARAKARMVAREPRPALVKTDAAGRPGGAP
jgi:protein O-mannosyl-transferase